MIRVLRQHRFHVRATVGRLGFYVERLAARGLLGLFFANTPAAIAPWGGDFRQYLELIQ